MLQGLVVNGHWFGFNKRYWGIFFLGGELHLLEIVTPLAMLSELHQEKQAGLGCNRKYSHVHRQVI